MVKIGQEIEYGTAKFVVRSAYSVRKRGEIWSVSGGNFDENGFFIDPVYGVDYSIHICDGTNGTPDLRGRFILGASETHAEGEVGGEETHTLTTEEMPSHNHGASSNNTGAHTHTTTCYKTTASVVSNMAWASSAALVIFKNAQISLSKTSVLSGGAGRASNSAGAHAHTITVNNNGDSTTHNNMPPYYALSYVMQIK